MGDTYTRRTVLTGLAATGVALSGMGLMKGTAGDSLPVAVNDIFAHGVASGDPDQNSVILWTRISGQTGRVQGDVVRGQWQMSLSPEFSTLVKSGSFMTNAARDYTVKILADGLAAGQTYFYRFIFQEYTSMTGRTKTLASGRLDTLGIAIASCSNFPFGYFNAYDAIAKNRKVDVVLHLGDYIYEYGHDGWGNDEGKALGRQHIPAHEIVSLEDYRLRHGQYKTDAGSMAMHAMHPLIPIWDDHESTNNPWKDGAQNHQSETEGSWTTRKNASLQAYYEWMPIREPEAGGSRAAYWRHFKFGDMASLITLETRHTARAKQISYQDHADLLKAEGGLARFRRDILGAENRPMLSRGMEDFLLDSLQDAVSADRPWKIIGNQIPMARTNAPGFSDTERKMLVEAAGGKYDSELQMFQQIGAMQLPIYLDTWDGYPVARQQFYNRCKAAGVSDLMVLTGDSHSFWYNQLFDDGGMAMGVELGTAGISSPGDFLRFGGENTRLLDQKLMDQNPEVIWTENRYNGYMLIELTKTRATASVITVSTVSDTTYSTEVIRTKNIVKDGSSLVYAS